MSGYLKWTWNENKFRMKFPDACVRACVCVCVCVCVHGCAGFWKFKRLYLNNVSTNRVKIWHTIKVSLVIMIFAKMYEYVVRFRSIFNLLE